MRASSLQKTVSSWREKKRRHFWRNVAIGSAGLASFPNLLVVACPVACAQSIDARLPKTPNIVIQWDNAALQGVRDTKMGPLWLHVRLLSSTHVCTTPGGLMTIGPAALNSARSCVSRIICGLSKIRGSYQLCCIPCCDRSLPARRCHSVSTTYDQSRFRPDNTTTDTTAPAGVGNEACASVLEFRHGDGSNQLGTLSPSGVPYSDFTGYEAVNLPSTVPIILGQFSIRTGGGLCNTPNRKIGTDLIESHPLNPRE
jgi:hypothetical protein